MALLPTLNPNCFSPLLSTTNPNPNTRHLSFFSSSYTKHLLPLRATSPNSTPNPKPPKRRSNPKPSQPPPATNIDKSFPETIPPKPRRGRKSEATAVEDFIRKSLSQTFESIRKQNSDVSTEMENVLKDNQDIANNDKDKEDDDMDDTENDYANNKKAVVEEEDPNWPLDADIGWGIRASEYFDQHPIKNVVGNDGVEIDWEGEMDDNYVKEINCLEWESIAYHPSPLIVLVFERYNNAGENWKVLKELEKAIKVYWSAKDRLPPRTVKIDINIERDLAYALKVKECPQLLFLKGNKIMYRERGNRTADELVQMIAHFYYNAKKPSCIDDAALAPPY